MPRDLSMISLRIDRQTLRRIHRLTNHQRHRLLNAYQPDHLQPTNRSATLRALIESGLDAITSPPYLTTLETESCRTSTPPRLLT